MLKKRIIIIFDEIQIVKWYLNQYDNRFEWIIFCSNILNCFEIPTDDVRVIEKWHKRCIQTLAIVPFLFFEQHNVNKILLKTFIGVINTQLVEWIFLFRQVLCPSEDEKCFMNYQKNQRNNIYFWVQNLVIVFTSIHWILFSH